MRTSPFTPKVASDKDIHFLVKKTKKAAVEVHNTITGIFPNSGDVPHSIRLYSALFYLVVICGTFAYLFTTGYNQTLHTQFLAPYLGHNAAPNKNCELIPIAYTGNFLISQDGYWEGTDKFSFNSATYRLDVTAYSATNEVFYNDMTSVDAGLQYYGGLAKTQRLDQNLMLWMSLVFVNRTSNAKRLTLTGDPLVIFDRDFIDGALSSVLGNCNVSSRSSFDTSIGVLSVSWNYKAFIAEPKCMKAMPPAKFGYNTLTKPELFELSFDIRTIITGVAMNLGLLKPEQLVEITKYRQYSVISGASSVIQFYVDPRYGGMDPLRCVTVGANVPYCTYRMGDIAMFPMFHHVGANLTYPAQCNCSTLTLAQLTDKTHNCNVFRFLSGFLFSSGTPAVSSGKYALNLATKLNGNLGAIVSGAHRAMFIASSYGQNSNFTQELNSPTSLEDAYAFCTIGAVSCSLLTFTSYDIVPANWAVNEYYTLMTTGACMDTITPAAADWARVIDEPYGPLVQNYQQCKNDVYQTMVNQAGIAIGNLQVIAPLCVIFVMLVSYLHKWWNKVPLDESYSKAEKDSALDAYAMSLLLSRDEKLKTQSFGGKMSIIAQIAEELGEHTYLSAMSHKTHHSNYTMNLSSHSLSISDSPTTRRVYDKIVSLKGVLRVLSPRSNSNCSPNSKIVPVDNNRVEITEAMAPMTPISPDDISEVNIFSTRRYCREDIELQQMSPKQQCANFLGRAVVTKERNDMVRAFSVLEGLEILDLESGAGVGGGRSEK